MSHLETSVTALKTFFFLMVLEAELEALHAKPGLPSNLCLRRGPWIRRIAHLVPSLRRNLNV